MILFLSNTQFYCIINLCLFFYAMAQKSFRQDKKLISCKVVFQKMFLHYKYKLFWFFIYFFLGGLEVSPKRLFNGSGVQNINTAHELTEKPSEDQLDDLAKDISHFWQRVGRKLHIPSADLQRIDKDNINFGDLVEKAYAMLMLWYEKDDNVTKGALKNALIALDKKRTALKFFPF